MRPRAAGADRAPTLPRRNPAGFSLAPARGHDFARQARGCFHATRRLGI
jgi:hypothetical protein